MKTKNFGPLHGHPNSSKWSYVFALVLSLAACMSCAKKKANVEDVLVVEPIADSVYLREGNRIAARTFDTLRSALLSAIGSQGIEGAFDFCNVKAYPLTATYADSVLLRRTSLRFRNPNNQPDSLELLVLTEMEELMNSKKMPMPKIVRRGSSGEVHFFKPILLQSVCLNCHGAPGMQIQRTTLARIKQLYPNDLAVNFKEGDLRGAWHITFKPQKK
jgi:Protein of unknown function (DUF3365)